MNIRETLRVVYDNNYIFLDLGSKSVILLGISNRKKNSRLKEIDRELLHRF